MTVNVIWKFFIRKGMWNVPMPGGAVILSAGYSNGLCVWARVVPSAPVEARRIRAVYTGDDPLPVLPTTQFVGTVQIGDLVYHVFDEGVV